MGEQASETDEMQPTQDDLDTAYALGVEHEMDRNAAQASDACPKCGLRGMGANGNHYCQASDAEQEGETVQKAAEQWMETARQYAQNADYWRERAEAAEAAVPDAPGVVPDGTAGSEWIAGYNKALQSAKHEGRARDRDMYEAGYEAAKLSYLRPVPAQPSLEEVIGDALFGSKTDNRRRTWVPAVAAAVRAAFPELNEGGK